MELGNLDDLPKYSPWPKRLLGSEPLPAKTKIPQETEREFGREKWGMLLDKFRDTPGATLDHVDGWAGPDTERTLTTVGEHLVLMTAHESHAAYIAYIADALEKRAPATALVELGCGYGSVILGLGIRDSFKGMRLLAADFTSTGPELAGLIANAEGLALETGHCDFTSRELTDLDVPPGALVFTAYAAQYVEELGPRFVEGLIALEPKAVVHIEPVYEHAGESTLLGLLRQRYIQANGYNRNLSTILHDHEALGSLEILEETAPAFGPNPLLAASVIAWKPRG